jgi:magnesium transporter
VIVDCAVYEDGKRRPGELRLADACEAGREPGCFVWIGLHHPTAEEFDAVREEFELHELAVEDAVKAHQRPKLEVFDDTVLIVMKTARYVDPEEVVEFAELQLIVGDGFIISVRHGEASALAQVRHQLEHQPELLRCGPIAVVYAVADRVVDDYAPVMDGIEVDIEQVEEDVFREDRSANPAERIYRLKREVIEFSRAASALNEALVPLVKGTAPHAHPDTTEYFRDVADHLARVVGRLDGAKDLLTDTLSANLAQISVRQNDDMRTISAWAAVIAVPTLLAGVWGMNFRNMPELSWDIGYPFALGTIVLAAFLVHRRLKSAGWL